MVMQGAHFFNVYIEVYCQEYDISGNFTYKPTSIIDYEWNYEEGDILNAKIIRKINTETGEILSAYISECRKG